MIDVWAPLLQQVAWQKENMTLGKLKHVCFQGNGTRKYSLPKTSIC